MKDTRSLEYQVNRFGFWSVLVAVATGVLAMFLPLDAPGGYTAEHADRVAWLNANRGTFIFAWANQIVAMFSLSAVFASAAWMVAPRHAFRAILGALFVAMATMAFIVPKFIAVWTIPLLADSVATGAAGSEMANALLLILNVSVPFSLYTSFDYLGFWLYAVFALIVAGSLYGERLSEKLAAVSLGLYGLIYHSLLISLLLGGIAPVEIEGYFLGASLLLIVNIVALAFAFKSKSKEANASSITLSSP